MHIVSMAVPFMKQQSSGSISIMSSSQGQSPDPVSPISSMAHSMIQMLVKCTALEVAYHGIRINAVAAGIVNSNARTKHHVGSVGLSAQQNEAFLDHQIQNVPLGALPEPKEIAASLLYLASNDASFMNGEILTVDGG